MVGAIEGVTLVAEGVWGNEGDSRLNTRGLERRQGAWGIRLGLNHRAGQTCDHREQQLHVLGIH
jgi:hypothetical protein